MADNGSRIRRFAAAVATTAAVVAAALAASPATAGTPATPTLAAVGAVTAPNGGDAFATVPSMAVDAAKGTLYALEAGRDHSSLAVVDTATNTVTSTVTLPRLPNGVAVDAGRGYVYVTVSDIDAGTSALWVFAAATRAHVATIPLGAFQVTGSSGDSGIGVDTATGAVYIPGASSRNGAPVPSVLAVSAAQVAAAIGGTAVTPTAIAIPDASQRVASVTVDAGGGLVYAAGAGLSGSSLYVIATASNTVTATVPLSGIPNTLTADATTGTVYVSQRTPGGSGIAIVVRGGASVSATIGLPAQAASLETDPGAGILYASVSQPFEGGTVNELVAISTGSKALLATSPLPTPADVTVDTASATVYVSGAASGNTTIAARRLLGVSRVAGSDRYATSVAVSKAAFPGTAPVVYIASGVNYPDALAAGPAATKRGGPLLLTTPYDVPGAVIAEVQRLHPSSIVVVGGPFPIGDAVLTQLRAAVPGATVSRAAGDDRFATSRAVASGAFTTASTVYLASGNTFPDALSAGGAAGAKGAPILLVDGNAPSIDPATAALLVSLKAKNVRVVGGPSAVSAGLAASLTHRGYTVSRIAGADRYGTALAVNKDAYSHATTALLATGFGFPDALSATTLAGTTSSPLYLAPSSCVPRGVLADFRRLGVTTVTLVGGPSVLTASAASLSPCAW